MLFGKRQLADVWVGATDCHSHILPGVDDGVSDMETSLKILAAYEKLQIREVWCTPHVMEDIPNTTEGLKARFAELQAAYKGPVKLNLAAEYMMDGLFLDRLEQDDLLTHGHEGNALLVETSYYTPPMDLKGILESIKRKGYYPILAHPERYLYMKMTDYEPLKKMGLRFQLNVASLTGGYGKDAVKKAQKLLKDGAYNFIGSDIHRYRQVQIWDNRIPKKWVQKVLAIGC
ncbi:MAG: capsular biosynthesis protein [Bacteroidales bacterium]|nr:capsular biosynthesis protein [Bacteroidales bacterium]